MKLLPSCFAAHEDFLDQTELGSHIIPLPPLPALAQRPGPVNNSVNAGISAPFFATVLSVFRMHFCRFEEHCLAQMTLLDLQLIPSVSCENTPWSRPRRLGLQHSDDDGLRVDTSHHLMSQWFKKQYPESINTHPLHSHV